MDEDYTFYKWKKRGVGKGHSKTGRRAGWTKKYYFEQDLLTKFVNEMKPKAFKARFAGYRPEEINWFFQKIKNSAIRPKETEVHCRNKLLMWIDKLHNCLSYHQINDKYQIGVATAKSHIDDILKAIIKSFRGTNVVSLPTLDQRLQMVKILKQKGAPMPDAIFSVDGSHTRCTGRDIQERVSHKYRWLPCFNVMFLIERVFGTIVAFSLDPAATKHDIKVLKESWFGRELDEVMDGWIILADKGYIGYKGKCVAPVLRLNMKERKAYSKNYWYNFNVARSDVERIFGDFFYNKFKQLGKWTGKSLTTFTEFSANVICCIILYISIKMNFRQTNFLLRQNK